MTSTNIMSVPVQPSPSGTRKKGQAETSADQGDFFQLIQNKFQGTDFMGKGDATAKVGASSSDVMKDAVKSTSSVDTALSSPGNDTSASTTSVDKTDSSAMTNSGAKVSKQADTAENDELTDEEKAQVVAAIGEFAEDVSAVISEILPVSAEDVAQAMEDLGLDTTDLLSPSGVSQLVAALTGAEDETAILTMDEGKELFDAIGDLAKELMSDTGLSADTLKDINSDLDPELALAEVTDPETLPDPAVTVDSFDEVSVQTSPVGEDNTPLVMTEEVAVTSDEADRTAISMTSEKDEDKMALQEDEVVLSAEDAPVRQSETRPQSQNQSSSQDSFTQGHKNPVSGAEIKNETPVADGQFAAYVADDAPQVEVSQVSSYTSVNTTDVIEQIVSAARTTITNEVREVSLLLNPQNLGRMIMQVTEREGDISARLVAQNEAVKEALEKQLTVLKEQLNAAGIKVTEVEVTVSTHEFEQALEQGNQMQGGSEGGRNGRGAAGEAEADAGSSSRRSIDLSSEDGIPEDMTEAEALEASIMKDSGNSVSYSA